jgi:small subunit ribosomal protein S20
MPIIKSAKKRVRQTRKATARNARVKKSLRSTLKSFTKKPAATSLSKAQSAVDVAVKKGLMHPNKAARKKRQLAAAAKTAGVKLEKKAAKKTAAASNPTAKKAPAKKPAAKKSPAKKTGKK